MTMTGLFEPAQLGEITLANRVVMAPMTRSRADAEAMVERRGKMAEDKIAAEERAAVQQLRAAAADAATRAAARLIAEQVDAKTDSKLVDGTINDLGRR